VEVFSAEFSALYNLHYVPFIRLRRVQISSLLPEPSDTYLRITVGKPAIQTSLRITTISLSYSVSKVRQPKDVRVLSRHLVCVQHHAEP